MKKLVVFFSVFCCLLLFYSKSYAITWQEILSLAKQNSNELKISQKQMEASKWVYYQSYSNFLPELSADLSFRTSTNNAITSSYGLSTTQYIFKGLENYYNLKSTRIDYEYYKADFKKAKSDIYYNLRLGFIDLLTVQENIQLLNNILNRRKENTALIQLRYESGREDIGSLLLTKAAQVEAEYNISSAKRKLKLAQINLSQLLDKEILQADEKIKIKDIKQTDFNVLVKNSPSYIMEKYNLESAQIAKKSTISKFLPSVSISNSYQNSGNNSFRSSWSLSVSYSLFSGGSDWASRKIYDLKLYQAVEDLKKTQKEIRYNVEKAFQEYKNSVELLQVKKIYLDATQERAKISRAKYINGLLSYDEWNRIEDSYISAQQSMLSYQNSALYSEAVWYNSYGDWIK